eukprot:3572999-Alexandrium_andersonii.AAC.1
MDLPWRPWCRLWHPLRRAKWSGPWPSSRSKGVSLRRGPGARQRLFGNGEIAASAWRRSSLPWAP